jgi:hypothetical protein
MFIKKSWRNILLSLMVIIYTLNGLKLNFFDRITGLAGLDLYPVYPVILSK